jgi:hypothetical protein
MSRLLELEPDIVAAGREGIGIDGPAGVQSDRPKLASGMKARPGMLADASRVEGAMGAALGDGLAEHPELAASCRREEIAHRCTYPRRHGNAERQTSSSDRERVRARTCSEGGRSSGAANAATSA